MSGSGDVRRAEEPYRGPADATLRREWRSERRAVVRRHHPDRGGDGDTLQQHLEDLDLRYARLEDAGARLDDGLFEDIDLARPPRWQPVTRAVRRGRRGLLDLTRTTRSRIPSGWPGHRHYFDL